MADGKGKKATSAAVSRAAAAASTSDSAPPSDSVPQAAPAGILSTEDRVKALDAAVWAGSREFRAEVRRRRPFEALLVRGKPVTHRFHFIILVLVVAITSGVGKFIGFGDAFLTAGVIGGGAYGLFWLFLVMTGGEERERLTVDEMGRITSVKSGRDVEARSDFVRVAVPAAVLVTASFLGLSLIRDIAFPPPPICNVKAEPGSDLCMTLPNMDTLLHGTLPPATPGPGATPTPAPTAIPGTSTIPTPAPTTAPSGYTISQTQMIERVIRIFQLLLFLIVDLIFFWFLRRMLTGRWVLGIRPVHHRLSDE